MMTSFRYGPADGPPDLQVTADLPPQVCVRLRAGGCALETYFEYNSTISCSCTGKLICSRVGTDLTLPVIVFGSNDSQSGMPRPFTSSIACSIVTFFCVLPMTVITSPSFTEYDGMSTFLPFTWKCPWRTSCRACGRDVARPSR